MDCAITAAASAAAQAQSGANASGPSSLCEQGKRFAELVQMPAGEGLPGAVNPQQNVTADLYVVSPGAGANGGNGGGLALTNVIEQVRSMTMPQLQPGAPAANDSTSTDNDAPVDSTVDMAEAMKQTVAWQAEILRMSMMGDVVSSMNQGVRTLFQQQG